MSTRNTSSRGDKVKWNREMSTAFSLSVWVISLTWSRCCLVHSFAKWPEASYQWNLLFMPEEKQIARMSMCFFQDRDTLLQVWFHFFFISNEDKALVPWRIHRACWINSGSTNLNSSGGSYYCVCKPKMQSLKYSQKGKAVYLLRELFPRQVDKKSRGPQGERRSVILKEEERTNLFFSFLYIP